jgi:hypothetical protein
MEPYITQLPLELQQHILEEIPEYTRLSHNIVSGQNYLNCYKDITRNEFLNYLNEYNPQQFFIYVDNINQYNIIHGTFLQSTRHKYTTTIYTINYHSPDTPIMKQTYSYSFEHYLHLPNTKISFDLITSQHIYLLRRECKAINVKNYLNYQINQHLSDLIENNIIIDFITKVKNLCYILSNTTMIRGDLFARLINPIKQYTLYFYEDTLLDFSVYYDLIIQSSPLYQYIDML